MEHSEQVAQLEKLLKRLDTSTTVDAGGFRKNPTRSYVDPDLASAERDSFFSRHPQLVGMSADLPEPGSFMTVADLAVPILTTRDGDGRFRAFVNSCRHRGVVLEERERGSARRFVCSFHNWTYDGSGTLVGLPRRDHFGDVDTDCLGLIELPALEAHGILWVHPNPDGSIDLDELLGADLAADLAGYRFDRLEYLGRDHYDVACNWKLAMDTFGETYHFEILHKDTLANGFHGNVQCYDTFGRNHRMLLCKRAIDDMRHLPTDEWNVLVGALPVYWLFPNVQLIPNETGLQLVRAYPDPHEPGKHRTQVTFYLWSDLELDAESTEYVRMMSQRFAEIIRDEDYVASASQQRTANSGALEHVVFGRNEPALHHYHNTYRAALGRDPLPLLDHVT